MQSPVYTLPAARPGLRAAAALTLLALGLVPGCGPAVGDVRGKVFYQGKEVTSGTITMVGADGIPRNSEIAEDGSYQISKVRVGEAKVLVRSPAPDPAKSSRPPPKREGAPVPEESRATFTDHQKKTWRDIPIHYADVTRTQAKCTVAPGSNAIDIKLN
jgi:hypothetical protein